MSSRSRRSIGRRRSAEDARSSCRTRTHGTDARAAAESEERSRRSRAATRPTVWTGRSAQAGRGATLAAGQSANQRRRPRRPDRDAARSLPDATDRPITRKDDANNPTLDGTADERAHRRHQNVQRYTKSIRCRTSRRTTATSVRRSVRQQGSRLRSVAPALSGADLSQLVRSVRGDVAARSRRADVLRAQGRHHHRSARPADRRSSRRSRMPPSMRSASAIRRCRCRPSIPTRSLVMTVTFYFNEMPPGGGNDSDADADTAGRSLPRADRSGRLRSRPHWSSRQPREAMTPCWPSRTSSSRRHRRSHGDGQERARNRSRAPIQRRDRQLRFDRRLSRVRYRDRQGAAWRTGGSASPYGGRRRSDHGVFGGTVRARGGDGGSRHHQTRPSADSGRRDRVLLSRPDEGLVRRTEP